MTTEHTSNPPEDKFKRWKNDILNERENVDVMLDCAWKDGFRAGADAGADAELEACCEWLKTEGYPGTVIDLCATRRPKPPSLVEQALAATNAILKDPSRALLIEVRKTLEINRLALERLQELEKGNE